VEWVLISVKRKFLAQNHAIAKAHAELQEKNGQLEARIQELISENYELRCQIVRLTKHRDETVSQQYQRAREMLSEKLQEIEEIIGAAFDVPNVSPFSWNNPNDDDILARRITIRKKSELDSFDMAVIDSDECIPEETEEQLQEESDPYRDLETPCPQPFIPRVKESAKEPSIAESELELPQLKATPEMESTPNTDTAPQANRRTSRRQSCRIAEETPSIADEQLPSIIDEKTHIIERVVKQSRSRTENNHEELTTAVVSQMVSPVPQRPRKPLGTKSTNIRKTAPKENETMPKMSPVRRRSRGSQVNYALPSLRTKLRREQDKFVDAVVEKENVSGPATKRKRAI
jgi:hypothetical protein